MVLASLAPPPTDSSLPRRCKSLRSTYEAGKRGGVLGGWRKLKKDYVDELGDSIDAVCIGAWRGNGRKKDWFSPFLMAVWNEETETFQTLCRVMSGFTDPLYKELHETYSARLLECGDESVDSNETNRFHWPPSEVWEIRGADLTRSPVHTAGIGVYHEGEEDVGGGEEQERGIGLRFPRFIRKRPDKTIHEATSVRSACPRQFANDLLLPALQAAQIVNMFHAQFQTESLKI